MLLSCRFLNDVNGVNSWQIASSIEIAAGDVQNIYIQLFDASLDRSDQGFNPGGRRYMPAATSPLSVTLWSVDDAKKVVRAATQPYALDPSIWTFPILATDPISGTVTMNLILTETGGRILHSAFAPGSILRVR